MIKTFLLVFMLVFLSGCSDEKKIRPSGKKINITILTSFSKMDKKYGSQSLLGIEKANDLKRYLSNGDEIVLHVEDIKSLNSSDIKNSKILITSAGSNKLINLKAKLQKIHIPIIATSATNNEITSLSDNMIQICMSNNTEALVAAHFAKDEKFIDNVGIVYKKTNRYSLQLAENFKNIYTKLGGHVKFFDDISDNRGFMKFKHKDKKDIKLLFSVVNAKQNIKIINLIKKQNKKIIILSTDDLLADALKNEKSNIKLFNGIFVIEHYAHKNYKKKNRRELASYLKKHNSGESSYSFLAYDAYQLLYNVLNNCVYYDNQCINTNLKNSGTIAGIAGNFSIINSKAKRAVYIDKIEDAKLIKEIVIY